MARRLPFPNHWSEVYDMTEKELRSQYHRGRYYEVQGWKLPMDAETWAVVKEEFRRVWEAEEERRAEIERWRKEEKEFEEYESALRKSFEPNMDGKW